MNDLNQKKDYLEVTQEKLLKLKKALDALESSKSPQMLGRDPQGEYRVEVIPTGKSKLDPNASEEGFKLGESEKKRFDAIQKFVAEQIAKKKQNPETCKEQHEFNKELIKKLKEFEKSVTKVMSAAALESALGVSPLSEIKIKRPGGNEQTSRRVIASEIGRISGVVRTADILNFPPKQKTPATIMKGLAKAFKRKVVSFSKGFPSFGGRPSAQESLQQEFGNYAKMLVDYTNNKYGLASKAFSEHMPTEEQKSAYEHSSLAKVPKILVGAGDFIERAHHYPEEPNSRDQLVIDAVTNFFELDKTTDDQLIALRQAIAGVNALRSKIDKIYGYLNEMPSNVDMLLPNMSLIQPEARVLAEDLKKINDPKIKKIAEEVIKLADKLESGLPKDIKLQVKEQVRKEAEQLAQQETKPKKTP